MNLLPEHYKKQLRYEAWRRALLEVGLYSSIALVIAIMLLLPTYFQLTIQLEAEKERLDVFKQGQDYKNITSTNDHISRINKALGIISMFNKEVPPASPIIEDILQRSSKTSSTTLNHFSYERKSDGKRIVVLKGKAANRDHLQSFVEGLRQSTYIERVDNPDSNIFLLAAKDISYTLTITIKQ